MDIDKASSLMFYSSQIQGVLAVTGIATRIYRYKDPVARDECFVVDTESGQFPHVIHLKRPRLPNLYTINDLSVRDIGNLNKN